MFDSLKKFFGLKTSGSAFSADPVCERISDYVVAATSNLAVSKAICEKTRMAGLLNYPEAKQYIAGTLLNVLLYSLRKSNEQVRQLQPDAILNVLSTKLGAHCRSGYLNVDKVGDLMVQHNAPLPTDYPVSARSIVAEMCIERWFQSRIPSSEFDVFRREYFNVATKLYEDVLSDECFTGQKKQPISNPNERKLVCPECGSVFSINEYDHVYVREQPFLKKKILDGSLFRYKCHNCGLSGSLNYEMFYVDDDNKLFVHLATDPGKVSELKETKFYDNLKPAYSSYLCRIVYSEGELQEIIRIVDDGLDEYVVHMFKYSLTNDTIDTNDIIDFRANSFRVVYEGISNGALVYKFLPGNSSRTIKAVRLNGWKSGYQVALNKIKATGGLAKLGEFSCTMPSVITSLMKSIFDVQVEN